MLVQTKALVLHSIKYNDSSLIAHCYTETLGIQSFMLKGILSAKKGKMRKAHFQPLTLLNLQFQHKNKGGLNFIKDLKVEQPYQSIYTSIEKNTIALFLSEVLYKSLREEEANSLLFEYLENALLWLDSNDNIVNFHLLFLLKLTQFLGFYPNVQEEHGDYFNLEDGCFSLHKPLEFHLEGSTVRLLRQLLGMTFAADNLPKLNQSSRRELLNALVQYFELHLHGFSKPKSLDILHQIFR
jgi:DNA repair protein RecO (recombination protein O)